MVKLKGWNKFTTKVKKLNIQDFKEEKSIKTTNLTKLKSDSIFLELYEKELEDITIQLYGAGDSEVIINALLVRLVKFYDADRAFIFETDWDLHIGTNTYEYCAEGIKSQMEFLSEVDMKTVPRWKKAFTEAKPIVIEDVEELKEGETVEYEILTRQDIKTLMAVPLNKNIAGFIGVDNPKRFDNKLSLLRTLAYAVAVEVKERRLIKANTMKTRAYPIKSENEVRINMLGGLEIITKHGAINDLDINSDRACHLIAYLYFNKKQFIPNRKLIEILWPENAETKTTQSLRQLIYRVRKILEPLFDEYFIVYENNGYCLNKKFKVTSDVAQFEEYCNMCDSDEFLEDKLVHYEKALKLYKDNFLPQCKEVNWAMNQTTYLHSLFVKTVKQCCELLHSKEMYLDIYRLISYALTLDELDFELNLTFIEELIKQGNYTRAKTHFLSKRELFSDEEKEMLEEKLKIFQ